MLYSTAAYVSYKFEREIQIQSNDLNSLAASIQETLLGEHFQRRTRSINEMSMRYILSLWFRPTTADFFRMTIETQTQL